MKRDEQEAVWRRILHPGRSNIYSIVSVEKGTRYESGQPPWEPIEACEETRITIIPVGGSEYSRETFTDDIETLDWWRRQVGKTFNFYDVSNYTYDEEGFLRVDLPKLKS